MLDHALLDKAERVAKSFDKVLAKNQQLEVENSLLKSGWMSAEEVAQLLGVDKKFAARWLKGLPEFRSGTKIVRYKRSDVEARIMANTTKKK